MLALVYTEYGKADKLSIDENRPLPKLSAGHVLVRMAAASLNSWDWDNLRGEPYINKTATGLRAPKLQRQVLGCDIAGVVEAVASDVTDFSVGDRVFGDVSHDAGWGGFAEQCAAKASVLAKIPDGVSFVDAASLPQAGALALQGLRNYCGLKLGDGTDEGKRVLINGAGGGVGTLALQMLKRAGCHVTCVDAGSKLDILKELGADEVVDFRTCDFADPAQPRGYDAILDNVSTRTAPQYARALAPGGVCCLVGGPNLAQLARTILRGKLFGLGEGKSLTVLAHKPSRADTETLADWLATGKLRAVVDSTFPLREGRQAFEKFQSGAFVGKIVVDCSAAAKELCEASAY